MIWRDYESCLWGSPVFSILLRRQGSNFFINNSRKICGAWPYPWLKVTEDLSRGRNIGLLRVFVGYQYDTDTRPHTTHSLPSSCSFFHQGSPEDTCSSFYLPSVSLLSPCDEVRLCSGRHLHYFFSPETSSVFVWTNLLSWVKPGWLIAFFRERRLVNLVPRESRATGSGYDVCSVPGFFSPRVGTDGTESTHGNSLVLGVVVGRGTRFANHPVGSSIEGNKFRWNCSVILSRTNQNTVDGWFQLFIQLVLLILGSSLSSVPSNKRPLKV